MSGPVRVGIVVEVCGCGDAAELHDRIGCCNPDCGCRIPGPGGALSWLLVLDGQGRPLLNNTADKMHWRKRQEARDGWRDDTATLARAWRIGKHQTITITAQPRYPDLRSKPDCDAPAPSVKGALDGLVVAKVIPDDKPPHVASVTYLPAVVAADLPPALLLTVELVPAVAS